MSGFWQQFGKREQDAAEGAHDAASPAEGAVIPAVTGHAAPVEHTGPTHDGLDYLSLLRVMNANLLPRSYLEIGTSTGASLACVTCDAICIDPSFQVVGNVPSPRRRTLMYQMGSDTFFAENRVRDHFKPGVDLAFLDGMHRFEFLLRDFIHVERSAHRRSLVLMHDCLPLNARMAERQQRRDPDEARVTQDYWTGDVWRILPILKKYRPDLRVRLLDCPPTGIVAVSGLDPESDVLDRHYHEIVDEFLAVEVETYGLDAIWTMFPSLDSKALVNPAVITAALSVW